MRGNMQMADAPPADESVGFFRRLWRNKKCKLAIGAAIILIVLGAIGMGVVVWKKFNSSDKANSNAISTDLSRFYKYTLHDRVEPCENFYQFACSNLIEKYKNENTPKYDTMDTMENKGLEFLDEFFSRRIVESDSVVLKKIKAFYNICIDSSEIVEGKEQLLQLVQDIGGWPLLEGADKFKEPNSWVEAVRRINLAGFESIFPFSMEFDVDPEDSTKLAMVLKPFIDLKFHALPESEPAIQYIKLVANALGSTNPRVFDDASDCFVFESHLVGITNPPQTKSSERDFIRYSVAELSTKHPEILWNSLFDSAFTSTNVKITGSDTVIFEDPSYISRVSFLFNDTAVDTIINYIVWTVLNATIEFTHIEPRKASTDFQRRNVSVSKNHTCLEVLLDRAGSAMGIVYLQNNFNPLIQKEVQTIFNNIETQASAYLDELHWMSKSVKKSIVGSLTKIKMNLAFPDSDLIDYVKKLVIEDWDFRYNSTAVVNYRNLLAFGRRTKFERLRISQSENQKINFLELSTASDASYAPSINVIHVSANLLQKPFFDLNQPKYLSYGGVGFIIAHELTHGLEILFSCNNATCPSYDEFNNRKDCTKNLYNNYVLKGVNQKINGSRTLGENIADLMGLKLAYRAYDNWVATREIPEPILHGLNYTARQLFWVNAATVFCTYQEKEHLINTVETDVHSPAEARINVAFGTMNEFVRDYQCPIDSNVRSREKCNTF